MNPRGPDLLAWQASAVDPAKFGTSFAAARVSNLLAVSRAWLLQVAANLEVRRGDPGGVPLVGVAVIDRNFMEDRPPYDPPMPWQALPMIGLAPAVEELAPLVEIEERLREPVSARILLQRAAERTRPAQDTSAPAISGRALHAFLDGMTT